jgi:hypothetical protein
MVVDGAAPHRLGAAFPSEEGVAMSAAVAVVALEGPRQPTLTVMPTGWLPSRLAYRPTFTTPPRWPRTRRCNDRRPRPGRPAPSRPARAAADPPSEPVSDRGRRKGARPWPAAGGLRHHSRSSRRTTHVEPLLHPSSPAVVQPNVVHVALAEAAHAAVRERGMPGRTRSGKVGAPSPSCEPRRHPQICVRLRRIGLKRQLLPGLRPWRWFCWRRMVRRLATARRM